MIVAYLMLIVFLFVLINFLVDLLYSALDPARSAGTARRANDRSSDPRRRCRGQAQGKGDQPAARRDAGISRASPLAISRLHGDDRMVRPPRWPPWITLARRRTPTGNLSQLSIMDNNLAGIGILQSGNTTGLGTDPQGRDNLSAIIYGLRMSPKSSR